jgi:hypothetical protein
MGAAVASVLRLPLSAVVLATLLTSKGGTGDEPLIIVGVVVAYLVTLAASRTWSAEPAPVHTDAPTVQTLHPDGSSPEQAHQRAT